MIEISVHGRGGQGAVRSAQLLAEAAFIEGYEVQSFPMFGVERRGAPVQAFVRIDKEKILTRAQVKQPDYAIVLDPTLFQNRIEAKKEVFINTSTKGKNNFDATSLSLKIFPQAVNTCMIAFFAISSGIVKKESLIEAINRLFSGEAAQKNVTIIEETFKSLKNG
jgi:2-oxoacid:acceptor oxidoreductase gamma subunit (pyruvate/2-ketoisovalerate family)